MHAQLVGYDFKKKGLPTDNNIAVENSKVSNDYFWKTNKYTDQDVFGRILDLTALINKPDGYLKGSLSDTEDVDYYEFNITCLLYTSPSPRDRTRSRMPSSA